MKQISLILIFIFFYSSCIPLRIAPTIKDDKIMVAKKFKRKLPNQYAFIFEDPKNANEFYNYINTKFKLNHNEVEWNVPITIDGEELYLTFYETEIPTKTINLVPIIIDAGLESKGYNTVYEEDHFSRVGNWYLVLTVNDSNIKDCLKPNHKAREKVLKYLRNLRVEYLNTNNYVDVLFKN